MPASARGDWRWLWLGLIFCAALLLFTRHNTFPYSYHPDEDTKVRQIVTGKRNFFHPLLMLTTTDAAMTLGRVEKTPCNAAIAGRWVSATFSALAVCALAALAWRWTGWPGGVLTGLLVALNPLVFELAHYFKEDPALLLGLCTTFLALDIFWRSPDKKSAAFLGLGCALAISGKYLGAVGLLFALVPLILVCRKQGWRLAGWFALGLLGPLLLINLPLFLHWHDFSKGFTREMEGATEGHRGVGQKIPHAYYVGRIAELTPWGCWLGLAVAAFAAARCFRRWPVTGWLMLVFPFFFFALLSFSPKTAGRYLLPVEASLSLVAALGPAALASNGKRLGQVAAAALALLVGAGVAPAFAEYFGEFAHDDRSDLRRWLGEHTAEKALIAQDDRVDLVAGAGWQTRQVISSEFVADLGSLAELRSRGVTHVAVARQTYVRYANKNLKPSRAEKDEFERRARFYRDLFASGKPVWESPLGSVIYLHPGLRVYQISNPRLTTRED